MTSCCQNTACIKCIIFKIKSDQKINGSSVLKCPFCYHKITLGKNKEEGFSFLLFNNTFKDLLNSEIVQVASKISKEE
jgi:hypothetical protein